MDRADPPLCAGGGAPALVLLSCVSAAFASDGDLQRVLLERGCVTPEIETVLKQGSLVAYRANCIGTSPKVIDIVCTEHGCSAAAPRPPQAESQ